MQIDALIEEVARLDQSGLLDRPRAVSLLAKLAAAKSARLRHDETVAGGLLESFALEVRAYIGAGTLGDAHGRALVTRASELAREPRL